MSLAALKKVRVALSLLFFVFTALVFLDFRSIMSSGVVRVILFLQFTPSLVSLFALTTVAATGCIAVLLLSLLFGRVYCSTICPLGTLQDIVSFISRKLRTKRYHEQLEPHAAIHFAFLIVATLPLAVGSIFAVNLLDPFSNFGRITHSIFRPMIILANNALSAVLELFKNYTLYPVELAGVTLISVVLPLLFLILIVWMSFQHGRLYCNSICPVGALLRLVSQHSMFRIAIDPDHCKSCQLCQRVCKAGCIDRNKKTIDFARCVDCFNCFAACPSGGLTFVPFFNTARPNGSAIDRGRRSFLLSTPLLFVGQRIASDTSKVVVPQKQSTIPEQRHHPVTPPGSLNFRHFTEACTACHVCISSCPSHVLQPSFLQYGLAGLLQPVLEFSSGYCNFECTVCSEVCPSGALKKMAVDEKKVSQAGKVVFIKENCVVYTEETDCGACTEHCPTKAVTMVPYKNSRLPEVKQEFCIGCGACEHACPTRPYRAIYVDGNPVHGIAKKKEPEKKQEVNLKDDFPF